MDGIINVYKEKGYTSHDVVAKLRGILRQKKIGHTGTLDPDAQGVLPVCLGKATKVCEFLTEEKKTYRTVLRLGVVTDTQDHTGKILAENPVTVSEEEICRAAHSFLGEQMQIPPMYSALKVNGRRLYELAREGIEIERRPRKVYFYEIQVQKIDLPLVTMEITCSKGTYIRTLCHDMGEQLDCGGCMEELTRTKVGEFAMEKSLTLAQIEELAAQQRMQEILLPMEEVFSDLPRVCCVPELDKRLYNGNPVKVRELEEKMGQSPFRLCDSKGNFIGIYQQKEGKNSYFPVKMFYP